jgi:hypothetical protein
MPPSKHYRTSSFKQVACLILLTVSCVVVFLNAKIYVFVYIYSPFQKQADLLLYITGRCLCWSCLHYYHGGHNNNKVPNAKIGQNVNKAVHFFARFFRVNLVVCFDSILPKYCCIILGIGNLVIIMSPKRSLEDILCLLRFLLSPQTKFGDLLFLHRFLLLLLLLLLLLFGRTKSQLEEEE